MKYLLFFLYLSLGFVIWIYVGAQILLPIIYGLPRSLYHFLKGEVTFWAIVSDLISPIFWCVALVVLGFILEWVAPSLNHFLIYNPVFRLGQVLATISLLSSLFTRKGRADLDADYKQSTLSRFQTVPKEQ